MGFKQDEFILPILKYKGLWWTGSYGYSLQDYVMKFVSGFLWVLRLTSTNKTDRHDITKILLKMVINTIKPKNIHNNTVVSNRVNSDHVSSFRSRPKCSPIKITD
jgi:hypothetical protein